MPPKAKVSREEILDKAFELTRKNGYENLTARLLAKELNCSTQPIFHIFENMDQLKSALYEKVRLFFTEVMTKPSTDPNIPLFLSMGLNYLELAQTEKHLFRLLCMSDSFQLNSLYELAGKDIPSLDSKVITKMWIFTHGIASILATNTTVLPKTEIRELLIEVFQDFYHGKPD
ncbi:hypothetical protein D3C73_881390 [compost metagenome]